MKRFVKSLLFVVIILSFIIGFNVLSIKSLASNNIDLSYYYEGTNELYDMSNENNPSLLLDDNGEPYKVDRYEDDLIGTNISGMKNKCEFYVNGDDPIINIIPRDYFTAVGTHYSYGQGYAYYINTTNEYYSNLTNRNYYKSKVLIVEYNSNIETATNLDNFNLDRMINNGFCPYQNEYYCISEGDGLIPSIYNAYDFEIKCNQENVIIPKPYSLYNGMEYEQTSCFVIKNVSCLEKIENLNNDNINDGIFFNYSNVEYSSWVIENKISDFDFTNITGNIFDIILNLIPFADEIQTLISCGTMIYDMYSIAKYGISMLDDEMVLINVENAGKEEIFPTSKENQIIKFGHVVKESISTLCNSKLINNCDINFQFQLSGESISSRLTAQFKYDIYLDNNLVLSDFYNEMTYDIYDSNICNISLDNKISNEYNNSNAYQTYMFKPYYSEDYYVNVTNSQSVIVKDSNNEEVIKKNNGAYYLEKYQEYYIIVSNETSTAKIYDIVIKTQTFYNNILNVDILGNGEIKIIYHSYYNGVFAIDTDNDNIILDDELYIFEYGKKYSIIIKNSSSDVQNVTLKLYVPSTDTSDGNKYHRYVIEDNGIYIFDKDVYIYRTVYFENKKSGYEVELLTDDLLYYKGIDIDSEYIRPLYLVKVNGEDVTSNSRIEIEIGETVDLKVYKYIDNQYVEYNFYNALYDPVVTFGLVEIMINDYLTGAFIKRIYVFGSLASEKVEMSYSLAQNEIIESTLNLLYLDNLLSGVTKRVLKIYNVEAIKNNTDPVIEKEFDEDNKIQFNIDSMLIDGSYNFLKTYYILEFEYIVADITLTGEYILESILESSLYDFIMSKEVSEQYVENLLMQKNEDNSININIILEHSKYIVASMNNINLYFEVYKPHQLVALIKEYTTYMEMSYDDEINYDAYLYGMAFYCNIRLMADLDFRGYIIDLSKINVIDFFGNVSNLSNGMYLYGNIDGNGKTISNLNIYDKHGNHLFIANYGLIQNVTFDELQGTLFKTYGPGEAYNIKLE